MVDSMTRVPDYDIILYCYLAIKSGAKPNYDMYQLVKMKRYMDAHPNKVDIAEKTMLEYILKNSR